MPNVIQARRLLVDRPVSAVEPISAIADYRISSAGDRRISAAGDYRISAEADGGSSGPLIDFSIPANSFYAGALAA